MIAQISRGKIGLYIYLLLGIRRDSLLNRVEKDDVIPVYGDLDLYGKIEDYLNRYKNYKDNYLHITLSFSEDDEEKLSTMNENERDQVIHDMTIDYIKHHTSGYDLDTEVIAYAERHRPKIKLNEKGEKRLEHVHIAIALYNPLSDTQLRTTFANTTYMDEVLQNYINKKYGFTIPRNVKGKPSELNEATITAKDRKYYINELEEIKNKDELLNYFQINNIEHREVKTKNNHYYKIINKNGKDINLRGKGFKHIQTITSDTEYVYPEKRTLHELEDILSSYYSKRIEQIDKRRSKYTKEKLKEIYTDDEPPKENSITMSYQQKIFFKHYGHLIEDRLKGFFVDSKDNKKVKFINKKKDIVVIDKGNKITTKISDVNVAEKVKLILDIAEAKEWNLVLIKVQGSDRFKKEMRKQIVQRLHDKMTKQSSDYFFRFKEKAKKKAVNRPINILDHIVKNDINKKEMKKTESNPDLKILKHALRAENVLQFAVEKYGLDAKQFEITNDNKINNIKNKQKAKNVIDFLQKEIHITTKEAIAYCQELFNKQPLAVGKETTQMLGPAAAGKSNKVVKLKERKNENDGIYKFINIPNRRRGKGTLRNMRKLSDIDMVHSRNRRTAMLLSIDARDRVWTRAKSGNGVQSAGDRTSQTSRKNIGKGRSTQNRGGREMVLTLSISKDISPNTASKWEEVTVRGYRELAFLMKQYPYSISSFVNGERNQANVKSYGNLLIYDIDNDKYDKPLSLIKAKVLLSSHGVSAMIMPSKSHNKPKKVGSGHQRKHGKSVIEEYHTAERYRIIIPTNKGLSDNVDRDVYREFQRIASSALKVNDYTDPNALNDNARQYYKSLPDAEPIIVKADKVLSIDKFEKMAIENVAKKRDAKEAEQKGIEAIRSDLAQHRMVEKDGSNRLSYVDVEAIINIPITSLILKLEQGESYKDGSYNMVKTDNAKYSIVEDNVAHDFKSDKTYNSLTYLQMQLGTNNLNLIARQVKNITGLDYLHLNIEAIKNSVQNAIQTTLNDKGFEQALREDFGVKYCKLNSSSVTIADQEIMLGDIGFEKIEIINSFRKNRGNLTKKRKL